MDKNTDNAGASDDKAKKKKAKDAKAKTDKLKRKKGPVKTDTTTISLEHTFTANERQTKSKLLADACARKEALENEKKTFNSEIKAKLDGTSAEIASLSRAVATGKEYRSTQVDVYCDFAKGTKEYRIGKKVVKREEMSQLDRQMSIPLD